MSEYSLLRVNARNLCENGEMKLLHIYTISKTNKVVL